MVKVNGKPVLEHLIDYLNLYGITEIIVNFHYKPEKIYEHFGTRLLYFYGAIGRENTETMLKSWLGDEYVLLNGDTLTDVDLKDVSDYAKKHNLCRVETWDKVYTGLTYCRNGKWFGIYKKKHHWQDIGTRKGLRKARIIWKSQ